MRRGGGEVRVERLGWSETITCLRLYLSVVVLLTICGCTYWSSRAELADGW
jgi:hypothetical protein